MQKRVFLEESDDLWCRRRRINLEVQVTRLFDGLMLRVGRSECGEELSQWNGIDGRQTEKDKWKETIGDDY